MKRTRLLMLWAVYLILLVAAVALAGAQPNYLRLAMPLGDALFVAGVAVGAAAGLSLLNLLRQQQQWFAEKHRLEDILHEQKSALNEQQEFRRALNHELRNPITAISVGVESLSAECGADTVRRLKTDVERVSGLLETVSALARLDTQPIERLPVKLDEIVQQAVEMIQAAPAARGCTLTLDLPPAPFPLPAVRGDEDLLFIALHNLVNNAVKFTPEPGEVVIRAFEDKGCVVLQVCDNGLGMSVEDAQRAGQPFRRGQVALDRKIPGSGLGLFQAYTIVGRHGGQISLHSEAGKGTVVTVRLPIGDVTPA